jgi:hypothetical protein
MHLDFQDFKKLYKNMREVEKEENALPPIINFKEFESWFSLLVSVALIILLKLNIYSNIEDISSLITASQNMLLYIISGLIAMLGFIVAGLAIMLSTTSNVVLKATISNGEMKYLLSVFTSFIYIAFIMVLLIIGCVFFYFSLGIKLPFIEILYLLGSLSVAYVFFFTLFYIISLLGSCINIFIFNFNTIEEVKNDEGNK